MEQIDTLEETIQHFEVIIFIPIVSLIILLPRALNIVFNLHCFSFQAQASLLLFEEIFEVML